MRKTVAVAVLSGVLATGAAPLALAVEPDAHGNKAYVHVENQSGGPDAAATSAADDAESRDRETVRGVVGTPDGVYGFTINNSEDVKSKLAELDKLEIDDKGLWGKDIKAVPDREGNQINSATMPVYEKWMKSEHESWNKIRDLAEKAQSAMRKVDRGAAHVDRVVKKVDDHNAAWEAMEKARKDNPNADEFRDMYKSLVEGRAERDKLIHGITNTIREKGGRIVGGHIANALKAMLPKEGEGAVTVPGKAVTEAYVKNLRDKQGNGVSTDVTVNDGDDDDAKVALTVYIPSRQDEGDLDADIVNKANEQARDDAPTAKELTKPEGGSDK